MDCNSKHFRSSGLMQVSIRHCTIVQSSFLVAQTFLSSSGAEAASSFGRGVSSRRSLPYSASASFFLASSISCLDWVKRASDCSFCFIKDSATFSRVAAHFLSAFTRATRTQPLVDSIYLVCNPASFGNWQLVCNLASFGNWHVGLASKPDLRVDHASLLARTAS